MKLLVASTIIASAIIGISLYYYYDTKRATEEIADNLVAGATREFSSDSISSLIGTHPQVALENEFSMSEDSSEFDSTEAADEDAEDFISEFYADSAYETCCPEERSLTADGEVAKAQLALSNLESTRVELVEEHGDIPEIGIYIDLLGKQKDKIPLTKSEFLEFSRLLAFFIPTRENIEGHEEMLELLGNWEYIEMSYK